MDKQIIIELIKGGSLVLAAGIPSTVAWWVSRARLKRDVLRQQLLTALKDIQFLLAVEQEYGEHCKAMEGNSLHKRMRENARHFRGADWSGKFSRKRSLVLLSELEQKAPKNDIRK